MQLVVKEAYGHNQYSNIIAKAKRVVSTIRQSSIAVEELVNRCGRSVIADCITMWNSTYFITKRLLTIRQDVNYALNHIGEDSLLASDDSTQRDAAAATDNSVSVCPPALKKFKLMSN